MRSEERPIQTASQSHIRVDAGVHIIDAARRANEVREKQSLHADEHSIGRVW